MQLYHTQNSYYTDSRQADQGIFVAILCFEWHFFCVCRWYCRSILLTFFFFSYMVEREISLMLVRDTYDVTKGE